jgi:hypothetical protein
MLIGSCFAENIGVKMEEMMFRALKNPFGVLYNPSSVANACIHLANPKPFTTGDLFLYNEMYNSFMHSSKFSHADRDECLRLINSSLTESAKRFASINHLIITFGTAYVYKLKSTGQTVANCHKLPAAQFIRERLTTDEIVDEWSSLLCKLLSINASMKVIFTVSPIRHFRDGAHLNQVSKATLLLAVQSLCEKFPDTATYFPAYELMMDELRDYRFYADDMLHPSPVAIDYIWERFCETYMEPSTRETIREALDLSKMLNHRPLNTSSVLYKQFLTETMLKTERFREKYPYICIPNEIYKC